jgi:hypothetical protein
MHRRLRASARLRPALLAALFGGLFLVVPALAFTSDINDFNLTENLSRYGGTPGTEFHVSSGGAAVQYRWLDSPSKSTVISSNNCGDYVLLGNSQSYSAGDTSYRTLWSNGTSGWCFVLQGRTQAGQGSMSLYDGRLVR